jgi:HSP20 family protein
MSTQVVSKTQNPPVPERANYRRPPYRVTEEKEHYLVTVSVPGVSREGVSLSLENDTLTLTATRTTGDPENSRLVRREIPTGDYRLVLALNVRIAADKIKAEVRDGILTLTLPKAEEVKARRIEVN